MFDHSFFEDTDEQHEHRSRVMAFLVASMKHAIAGVDRGGNRCVQMAIDVSAISSTPGRVDVVMPDDWPVGTIAIENGANGSVSVFREGATQALAISSIAANNAKTIPAPRQTKFISLAWDTTKTTTGIVQVYLMEKVTAYQFFGASSGGGGGTTTIVDPVTGANKANVTPIAATGADFPTGNLGLNTNSVLVAYDSTRNSYRIVEGDESGNGNVALRVSLYGGSSQLQIGDARVDGEGTTGSILAAKSMLAAIGTDRSHVDRMVALSLGTGAALQTTTAGKTNQDVANATAASVLYNGKGVLRSILVVTNAATQTTIKDGAGATIAIIKATAQAGDEIKVDRYFQTSINMTTAAGCEFTLTYDA